MAIKRRLAPRVKLAIHALGGSVLDPPLRPSIRDTYYDTFPGINSWPSGSPVIRTLGKSKLLVGHIVNLRAWVVTKEVEALWLPTGWAPRRVCYMPYLRGRHMTKEDAWKLFNVNRDAQHVGLFSDRETAIDKLVEVYEDKFDTVLPEW